ncbi:hypothetical protein [Zoogloea sp.]|uniref:hypothetical protein n=1 Tax=Zoogloea sp. TaxID=49181 RepID=UPI0014159A9B|nr:MAG: hypothetical protein F9K15_12755 [Zoogloea sp.]
MNIAQISSLTGRGAGLLAAMIEAAPLLSVAEFQEEASDHLLATGRETKSGSGVRNEGDTANRTAVTPDVTPRKLRLYSREVAVDNVRRQDAIRGVSAPQGLKNFYDNQLKVEALGIAEEFQDEALAGTDTTNGGGKYRMLGFSEFIKDANAAGQTSRFGFSTSDLAAMNSQLSLKLDTDANKSAFVEALMKLIAQVPGANAILVNPNLSARMTTIGKQLGAAGESVTSFGTKVKTFDGKALVELPTSAIPQNESDGTNSDCTSLYVVRFAEGTGAAFTTNSGFLFTDFEETSQLPSGIARLEMFVNLAVLKRNAVRRMSRIRL